MRRVSHLPSRQDGVEGLIALADKLGDATVFNLIRCCRTAQGRGNDPAGDTLTILAKRMVKAAAVSTGDYGDARKTVARQLGYDWRNRASFTRILDRVVGTDGDADLLTLARHHGDPATYDLIMLCRTARGGYHDDGREALTVLAHRMVDKEMQRAGVDAMTARQTVATRLGYTPKTGGNSRSNFAKILKGGRIPETRPNSRARTPKTSGTDTGHA